MPFQLQFEIFVNLLLTFPISPAKLFTCEQKDKFVKVTQTDIAKLSGVDRTTVSKILSGYQLPQFSDEIVKRVQETAAELGYKPKKINSSLDIAFVFPVYSSNMAKYSFPQRTLDSIMGISECLSGTSSRLHIVKYYGEMTPALQMSDAYIIWELSYDRKLLDFLNDSGKEIIVFNRVSSNFKGSYVIHDFEFSCRKSLEVLKKANHKKIVHVGEGNDNSSACAREQKYLEECAKEMKIDLSSDDYIYFGEHDKKGRAEAVDKIIKSGYTGIIASNDLKAYELISEFSNRGISVPEDISIIGNHKVQIPFEMPVDLTSFITQWGYMGRRAAELLLSRARLGEKRLKSVIHEVIEPEFYEGETVRCL